MDNKFLNDLQEDILDGKGYSVLYMVLFVIAFTINGAYDGLYSKIFRVALAGIALLFLILVFLKCKATRDEKENKKIINYIFFFLLLTSVTVYQFMRN